MVAVKICETVSDFGNIYSGCVNYKITCYRVHLVNVLVQYS